MESEENVSWVKAVDLVKGNSGPIEANQMAYASAGVSLHGFIPEMKRVKKKSQVTEEGKRTNATRTEPK